VEGLTRTTPVNFAGSCGPDQLFSIAIKKSPAEAGLGGHVSGGHRCEEISPTRRFGSRQRKAPESDQRGPFVPRITRQQRVLERGVN
jgi:hypothetical protein